MLPSSDFNVQLLREREKRFFGSNFEPYNPLNTTPGEFSRKMAIIWDKLKAGTFGKCEQCGRLIPNSILANLPEEQVCPTCRKENFSDFVK